MRRKCHHTESQAGLIQGAMVRWPDIAPNPIRKKKHQEGMRKRYAPIRAKSDD